MDVQWENWEKCCSSSDLKWMRVGGGNDGLRDFVPVGEGGLGRQSLTADVSCKAAADRFLLCCLADLCIGLQFFC